MTSSVAKHSSAKAPATLGSSARRRGRVDAHHLATTTTTVTRQQTTSMPRWTRSIAWARSASGKASSRWPSSGSVIIHATCPIPSGIAYEATSRRSKRVCSRPLVSSVRISVTNGKIQ